MTEVKLQKPQRKFDGMTKVKENAGSEWKNIKNVLLDTMKTGDKKMNRSIMKPWIKQNMLKKKTQHTNLIE